MDFARVLQESLWPLLLSGWGATILFSVISIVIGLALGLGSCLMDQSKRRVPRVISKVYVWIIRGTPMVVQAMFVYFAVPQLVQLVFPAFRMNVIAAGIITLSLNAGAYLSEIFRGGIQAVDKGQIEAARSLGMSSSRTMARIVLPQAVRIATPSMVNQFIITIKDSSILTIIGLPELATNAGIYVGATYQYVATWVVVAVLYLIPISVLMVISKRFEKKMAYDRPDAQDRVAATPSQTDKAAEGAA